MNMNAEHCQSKYTSQDPVTKFQHTPFPYC